MTVEAIVVAIGAETGVAIGADVVRAVTMDPNLCSRCSGTSTNSLRLRKTCILSIPIRPAHPVKKCWRTEMPLDCRVHSVSVLFFCAHSQFVHPSFVMLSVQGIEAPNPITKFDNLLLPDVVTKDIHKLGFSGLFFTINSHFVSSNIQFFVL
jgi:hypothetical protein